MSKHTPAPWRIGRPSIMHGVQIFQDQSYPLTSEVICTMPEKGKNRTANARLIAMAPEMLYLLEQFVKSYDACGECELVYQEAKNLIAKATQAP